MRATGDADLDFNPMIDRQAEDRCHRIGQVPLPALSVCAHRQRAFGARRVEFNALNVKETAEAGGRDGVALWCVHWQTRPVTIYKLVSAGTVDEKIYSIAERKGHLANTMLGEGTDDAADQAQDNIQDLIQEILGRHLAELEAHGTH